MTPALFDRMLHRSFVKDVTVEGALGKRGHFWTRSLETTSHVYYATNANTCSCPAGQTRGYCCHRARVLFMLGLEPRELYPATHALAGD